MTQHIIFKLANGSEQQVQYEPGEVLMRVAVDNSIRGIDAECGGQCNCGTCHVIFPPEWLELLPPLSECEEDLLSFLEERRPGSRLSCQVLLTREMSGILITIPSI